MEVERNLETREVRTPLLRSIVGKVVAISGRRTISVEVVRQKIHPRYKKLVKTTKRFLVDDPHSLASLNDQVKAIQCRPLSKLKSFRLTKVLRFHKDFVEQHVERRRLREQEVGIARREWLKRYASTYAYNFQKQLIKRRRKNRKLAELKEKELKDKGV